MLEPDQSSELPQAVSAPQAGPVTRFASKRPVLTFVALTYLLGWGMAAPRILSWLGFVRFNVPNWWVAASFYAPCVAAVLVQWITQRNLQVARLGSSVLRIALGIVVGFLLMFVLNTTVPALIAEKDPLRTLNWAVFFSAASYHFFLFPMLSTVGEEIGWRGFALPRLQTQYGPAWASVLVGLMWAGFSLPGLVLVQMWPVGGILLYAVGLIGLSIEMTFAANLSGFSIIVAVIMHGLSSQNGFVMQRLIARAAPRSHWQLVWSLANLVVPAVLLMVTRGRLGAGREPESDGLNP